jgi:hypothetical protein
MSIPLTREYLLQRFHYDRENGQLIWKTHSKRHQFLIGKIAGATSKKKTDRTPYRKVTLFNYPYPLHRLIWVIEHNEQPEMIDHIDGDGLNNRIENLRSVTNRINQQNGHTHREGRLPGARWNKNNNNWRSWITIKGKRIEIGSFKTEQEAHQAYMNELKVRGLS